MRHLCAVPLLEPIVRVVLPRTLRHRLTVLAPGRFPTWAISDQQSTRGVQSRSQCSTLPPVCPPSPLVSRATLSVERKAIVRVLVRSFNAPQQAAVSSNQARSTPKTQNGSARHVPEWSFAQLVHVVYGVGDLQLGVKKFVHGLGDFRSYIQPDQQWISGFTPDELTVDVCSHVLEAALASLAGER